MSVLIRQPLDELVRVGAPGGVFDLRIGGVVTAVGDVVANRSVEEEDVLLHDRQQPSIRSQPKVANVGAVEQDPAPRGIVEPRHQVGDRRLAGAASADQRDDRTSRHDDVEIANHGPSLAVLELDVLEADLVDDGRRVAARRADRACPLSIASTSNTRSIAASDRCSSENELTMFQTGFSSRNVYHWNAMMSPIDARPMTLR